MDRSNEIIQSEEQKEKRLKDAKERGSGNVMG